MYEDDKIQYQEEEADEVGEIASDGEKAKRRNIKKSFIVTFFLIIILEHEYGGFQSNSRRSGSSHRGRTTFTYREMINLI